MIVGVCETSISNVVRIESESENIFLLVATKAISTKVECQMERFLDQTNKANGKSLIE